MNPDNPPLTTPRNDIEKLEVAMKLVDTLLQDQIARADSLNATAGVFAGLGGVVTTLAGLAAGLDTTRIGKFGVATSGSVVVAAVVGLVWRRPGREPDGLMPLLRQILSDDDVIISKNVLLNVDSQAAQRNELRLRRKAQIVVSSALLLAVAITLLVIGMVH